MKNSSPLIKLFFSVLFMLSFTTISHGQILKKLGKSAEKAAERVVERRVESETTKKTDQVLDSILEPGQKKGKKKKSPVASGEKSSESSTKGNSQNDQTSGSSPSSNTENATINVYSKFDFVSGDKPILFDDFKNDFMGDFPSKWNSNGSGEIVAIGDDGDKWMEMRSGWGTFYIPNTPNLPEDFTVEFDFLTAGLDNKTSSNSKFAIRLDDNNGFVTSKNTAVIELPLIQYDAGLGLIIESWSNGKRTMRNSIDVDIRKTVQKEIHVSMAINKQRVRLWLNEKKYVDIPRLLPDTDIKAIKFTPVSLRDGIDKVFVRNLKIAQGGIDLRRKLISEGMISTNGILFDSRSDKIQPQSMGIIRQMYQVLQQEKEMRLKIVGHTDSDGGEATNLNLSKQRAAAIKNILVNVYKVDAGRLETDGKGASEPIGDNSSPDGKAQNRRVEFIKQ